MPNQFDVEVPNLGSAFSQLMTGYQDGQKRQLEQTKQQAQQEAAQLWQSGNKQGALARLLQGGNFDAATAYGAVDQRDYSRGRDTKLDERHAVEHAETRGDANRNYALQLRNQNRLDDKTPTGFERNPEYGKVEGATPYRFMGGGPQDPAFQARVAAETAKAKGDLPTVMGAGSSVIIPNKAAEGAIFTNKTVDGGLTGDALDIRAAQWNNGDYEGATKNVGRGAQGGATLAAIANRAAEKLIEQGHTPQQAAELTSQNMQKFRASGIYQNTESRTGANREANLNIILKAADAAIPAALEASDKLGRTGWVPLNQIIQKGQVMASNPELRQFGMANLQLAEHWARAMNPTGVMRESDRDMALHFLSLADSPSTYRASVGQLKTQITRERDAIRSATPGHAQPPPAGGSPLPDPLGLR
jgi:hypothetical protein